MLHSVFLRYLFAVILLSAMTGYGVGGVISSDDKHPLDAEFLREYDDLSPLLEKYLSNHPVPAIAAAVVDRHRILAMAAAGERLIGSGVTVTLQDLWHIGSNAKSMTAMLAALLVEGGPLSWESTVAELFPEMKEKMHRDWYGVTLEQLLANRGGAPGNLMKSYPALWQRLVSRTDSPIDSRKALLEQITVHPPEAHPGTRYIYSNAGYAIAGAMIEAAAGQPWENVMHTRLFELLNMRSAGFGAPGDSSAPDQPWGHDEQGSPVKPGPHADNPPGIAPAGTVHLSINDWAKFAMFHLRGAVGKTDRLKDETVQRLHRPYGSGGVSYAMGWEVIGEVGSDTPVLKHYGSNTFWYSVIELHLDCGYGVLVVTNQGGDAARNTVDQVLDDLMSDLPCQRGE